MTHGIRRPTTMATFQTDQCDDGDTVHEPTVKEIDEIYNFILCGDMRFSSASEEVIERMLLTLDRVSNSINRREEEEEEEDPIKCDTCNANTYRSHQEYPDTWQYNYMAYCKECQNGSICEEEEEDDEEPRRVVMRVRKEQQETN